MAIKYITYEVAANCNMDCGFCFSDWRNPVIELDTEDAKRAILSMKKNGLEAINFTGGEPLLREDIGDILRYSKSLDLTTILSTNGILLEKRIEEIAGHVDFIGLPLDSGEENVHNHLRPTRAAYNHHGLVVRLIDMLDEDYGKIGVKVNTIVTQQNASSVIGIGCIIDGKAISWKLSHFIASGYGAQNEHRYAISEQGYLTVVNQCRKAYPQINIVSSVAHERDDCCRVISSDGHMLRPTDNGLVDLGNLECLTEQAVLEGFNQPKNERILRKTYLSAK